MVKSATVLYPEDHIFATEEYKYLTRIEDCRGAMWERDRRVLILKMSTLQRQVATTWWVTNNDNDRNNNNSSNNNSNSNNDNNNNNNSNKYRCLKRRRASARRKVLQLRVSRVSKSQVKMF
jgi:hypothetical protein